MNAEGTVAVELMRLIHRVSQLSHQQLADALAEVGLTEVRLAALQEIAHRSPQGCTQAELATLLGQAESSICTLIERMRLDGLVERVRSRVDRRKTRLFETPVGRERLAAGIEVYERDCRSMIQGLSVDSTELILDELSLLLDRLEERAAELGATRAVSSRREAA